MTPEQKIHLPNTKTVKTMDKQLPEQEENRVELNLSYSGERLNEKDVASAVMAALRKADEDCFVILAPTSSTTVKELEREVERLKGERKSLIKQLREFISMHETGLLPNRFTYEDAKMTLNEMGE